MRIPTRQTYVNKEQLIEMNGIKPDFYIQQNLDDLSKGLDTQLYEAVKELDSMVKNHE